MATEWISPTWRMPNDKNQSKFENYSLDFNGGSDYIESPSSSDLDFGTNDFTISAWVKTTGTPAQHRTVVCKQNPSNSNEWTFQVNADGKVNFYGAGGSVDVISTTTVNDGNWHHILIKRTSNVFELYIDNVLADQETPASQNLTNTANLRIGHRNSSYNAFFVGSILDVTIFNYALSSTQISYLYNSGTPQNPMAISGQPPVVYYPLGGSSTGSASTLTVPNESVPSATVFDFEQSSSQNIDIGDSTLFDSTSTFSFSTWCKLESYDNSFPAFIRLKTDQATGFIMGFSNYDAAYYGVWFGSNSNFLTAKTSGNISADLLGVWKHICLVYDGVDRTAISSYSLYINGIHQSLVSAGSFSATPNTNLIGQGNTATTFWDGEISNTQIWNTNLSAPEITTLYNYGSPLSGTQPQAANLRAWYPMNVDNANWLGSDWQIAEATSAYPQSFDFGDANTGSEYITTTYFPNGETNFTYSTWLNCNFSQRGTPLAAYGGSTHENFKVQFWTDTGGSMYVFVGGAYGLFANFPLHGYPGDEWTNISVVYDGTFTDADTATQNAGRLKLYINGNYEAFNSFNGTIPSTIPSGNTGFYLGTQTPTTYEYGGEMSNVMMFDNSLPETGTDSVETLYNNGTPLTTAIASDNLKAWYKLDNTETYLKPPPSQTQNLYEAWLIQNQKYPASVDNCLLFANNNYIRYDNFDLINEAELTLSFWYLHNQSINSSDRLIGSWDGTAYNFYVNVNRSGIGGVSGILRTNDGSGGFLNNSFSFGDVNTPAVGWRLLTVTYNGSVLKAYVNDEEVDSVSATGTIYDLNPYIGGARNYNQSIRDGNGSANGMRLSNVIYWNKALTAGELTTLYNNGTPLLTKDSIPQDSSMLLWNTLENKTETVDGGLYDKSGNSVSIQNIDNTSTIIVDNAPVSAESGLSSGMTESNLVNNNVSALNGTSVGMTTANLVNSDLTRSIPYSSYSMSFDGASNEYIDCGYTALTAISGGSSTLSTPMTISMWFKLGSSSSSRGLLNFGSLGNTYGGFTIRHQSSVLSFLKESTNLVSGGYTFTDTLSWHHLSFVYDPSSASNCYLYIDGVDTGVSFINVGNIALQNANLTNRNLIIGAYYGNADTFTGSISNCSIYNKLLTTDDVLTIYNGGVPNSVSNLSPVGWWSLGGDSYYDGTNFILPDLSANSNNGTSANMSGIELVGNGPSSSANGTATNMDIPANLKGNAPNSSSNAFSVNMNSQDRVADVPA